MATLTAHTRLGFPTDKRTSERTCCLWQTDSLAEERQCILAMQFLARSVKLRARVGQADVRTPDGQALGWTSGADVEALAWLPGQPTEFLVSTEDGLVAALDARKGGGAQQARVRGMAPGPGCGAMCGVDRRYRRHPRADLQRVDFCLKMLYGLKMCLCRVRSTVEIVSARQASLRTQSLSGGSLAPCDSIHRQDGPRRMLPT